MSCQPTCPTCAELRGAVLQIVGERGIEGVTCERIREVSGITPAELVGHYESAEACLYATYEEVAASVLADFAAAFLEEPGWRRALQLAGRNLLERMAARPEEARLCFVEVLRGDHELQRRRAASRQRMVELFSAELRRRVETGEVPETQLELLIGAGFQSIAQKVADGEVSELPELEPELVTRAYVFEPAEPAEAVTA